ncbi:MAG: GntR family transcriptional regulator [Alphaproteobacteria bacterium]
MSFDPVAAPSALIDQVHDRLVNAIADGTLPPGQRLTQEEIAVRLGVSRQPVSHALQVLRRRGLVEESGKRGLIVAPLDAQRMRDLYQVRAVLEALAASLAAARVQAGAISRREIDEGTAIVAHGVELAEAGAVHDLIDADVSFHSYVHRMSGNSAIVETVSEQWPHFRRSMGAVYSTRIGDRIWAEHRDILSGIVGGDANAAADAARRHIELATEEAVRRLAADKQTS